MMDRYKLQKIFGVGPTGAGISIFLWALFKWADRFWGGPHPLGPAAVMQAFGAVCVILGLGLHFWTVATLRHWWVENKLCTMGPFKYFRHPMYAAWITLIASGVVLFLNSWVYCFWLLLLHPLWHRLVRKEEIIMRDQFGDEYVNYARRTGRFIPRVLH